MYIINPQDNSKSNSCYACGLSTMFYATDIVKILNGDMTGATVTGSTTVGGSISGFMLPYLYDVNLTLPPGSYDYVRNIGGLESVM